MERAGRDEQDVIGLHHPVLRVDRRPLDDRQDVALHAFAADVGTVAPFPPRDLVDLVEEDDARLLHALDRGAGDAVHVDQLLLLFLQQRLERLGHRHAALPRASLEEAEPGIMSFMLMSTSSTDEPAMISKDGKDFSRTSISSCL